MQLFYRDRTTVLSDGDDAIRASRLVMALPSPTATPSDADIETVLVPVPVFSRTRTASARAVGDVRAAV
jgi:hypothetical protein